MNYFQINIQEKTVTDTMLERRKCNEQKNHFVASTENFSKVVEMNREESKTKKK